MNLAYRLDNDRVVVKLDLIVDIANIDRVRTDLLAIIAAHRPTSRVCVLDLGAAPYVLPTGLSLLAHVHRHCRQHGGHVRAVSDRPLVRRVFRLVGMHRVVPLYSTLDEALRADDPLPRDEPLPSRSPTDAVES
ncbi:STAS domain-containing protein [Streptomyces sp. SID3343]|uniref:STAS domain-containing protein n=1 Tax=Streptomyces sp. SID3343 TaxID=2690260 RepID=UPI00136CDF1F|nr:STAS domain-containing protein [Streptomyces sp. SID3343]MYW01370.1 STAS domain-containing protein [Streptomyces sp. SID3343]